jgi:hypothetical protein
MPFLFCTVYNMQKYSVRLSGYGLSTGFFVTYGRYEKHARFEYTGGVIMKRCKKCKHSMPIEMFDYVLIQQVQTNLYFGYNTSKCKDCREDIIMA